MRRIALGLSLLVMLAPAPVLAARDVILVLDNSGSMRRNDPQRLAAPAVMEFIAGQPRDTRVGIVLFGAAPELALPLMPVEVAAEGEAQAALKRFNYSGPWTETAGAVERALYELRSEGRRAATRAIVLMTDGLIDTGDPRKDTELNQWLRQDLARQAHDEQVHIFGIAFTEQADYRLLQSIAAGTGGEYFRVLNAEGIARALKGIETVLARVPAAPAAGPVVEAPPAAPETVTPTEPIDATAPVAPANESSWPLTAALAAAVTALLAAGLTVLRRRRGARSGGPSAVLYDNHERHELDERPVVIGRASGNDPSRYYIVLPEKTVGRWHATIERRGQTFWLRDEGSVNGTFINGERVVGERALKHRDSVRIHNHQFEFEIPELADADRTMLTPADRLGASG